MYVLENETPVPVKMWADGVPVEDAAKRQLVALSHLPFIFRYNNTAKLLFMCFFGFSDDACILVPHL